jgi:hypothetical protein
LRQVRQIALAVLQISSRPQPFERVLGQRSEHGYGPSPISDLDGLAILDSA